jgi:hypothetical protein
MEFYEKAVPRATALASPAVRATLAQLDAQAVAHSPAAAAVAAAAATRRSSSATAAGASSSGTGGVMEAISAFFGQGAAAGWEAAAAAATTAAGVQAGEDIAEAEAQVRTSAILAVTFNSCCRRSVLHSMARDVHRRYG